MTEVSINSQNDNKLTERFPLINLQGSSKEIGYQHGYKCKNLIEKNITFYDNLFNLEKSKLKVLAAHYKEQIQIFNPKYCVEMDAIAEGAEVEPFWIYALNSRTEIINRLVDECTAVYFKNSALLGQNWDWLHESEDLAIVLKIKLENGLKLLMMTEPGIIGKIGLNSYGLGVCLNYLHIEEDSLGVPVHVLLRNVLESRTIESATRNIDLYDKGTTSNILIGDKNGNYLDLELAIERTFFYPTKNPIFIHTNHYLAEGFDNSVEEFAGSISRFERASTIAKSLSGTTKDEMKLILLEDSDPELPICRKYSYVEDFGNLGTVTTILMDLKHKTLELSMGNPFENDFKVYRLRDK